MRSIIGLAIVLALASGLLGAFAYGQLFGPAGAAPAVQAREDQITIWAEAAGPAIRISASYGEWPGPATSHVLALDTAEYPTSLVAKFEATWFSGAGATSCLRLYDKTLDTAVPGGEVCHTSAQAGGIEAVRVRSGEISLPFGEHEYIVQSKCEPALPCQTGGSNMTVSAARIIAEWTERPAR